MSGEIRNGVTSGELATILGWTFLFNYAVLLLWFLAVLLAPDWIYGMNARWFAIDRHEFELVNYCGIAFLKLVNLAFFLCPYIAIKLLLRKNARS